MTILIFDACRQAADCYHHQSLKRPIQRYCCQNATIGDASAGLLAFT